VTGIDDHSRFCVIARLVKRATAQPVCDALLHGLRAHGVPDAILTDNGKVFTGRFTLTHVPVRFDRICRGNGIRHLLTAPYSPTTTGKIERLHKTMRAELFNVEIFATLEDAQAALDLWVERYNTERPHQSIGDMPPHGRFRLAHARVLPIDDLDGHTTQEPTPTTLPPSAGITRWVDPRGDIGIARFTYHAGREFDGERVDVVARGGLVGVVWAVRADIRERSGCFLVSQMRVLLKKEPPPVRNVGGVNDRLQSGPVEGTAKEDPGYGYDLAEQLLGEANTVWPFLAAPGRIVQRNLDIAEYTDPAHTQMVPHSIVCAPGLIIIYMIYNGYWFFGRPAVEELRMDLRAVLMQCHWDWDLSDPAVRAAWSAATPIASTHRNLAGHRGIQPPAVNEHLTRCGQEKAEEVQSWPVDRGRRRVVLWCVNRSSGGGVRGRGWGDSDGR